MTAKIFRSIMAATIVVLIACAATIIGFLYDYFGDIQVEQLRDELSFAAVGVEEVGESYLTSIPEGGNRLTWIAADGSVIYDAEADENKMENHAEREEVKMALESGEGISERYSKTLLEKTIYCAKRLSDGSVLRISVSSAGIGMLTLGMLQPICFVLVAVLILAAFLAHHLASRIIEPLNKLDLDHPLENKTYDELAPLLTRINSQHKEIDKQYSLLKQKTEEFDRITSGMNEGMILLDAQKKIISINRSAMALFAADRDALGKDLSYVERTSEVSEALKRSDEDGHSEITLDRRGKNYQFDISRIDCDGKTVGTAILILDVTEKLNAERGRREFTANVSHELKTPLTAIIGSSEIIQSGMVKTDDIPRFVGHIHDEAVRLLTLIEDIIGLSRLDEGIDFPLESVDVSSITADVVSELSQKAADYDVKLTLYKEPCVVSGVPRLVNEIASNLIENAIKYNVRGGSVDILVTGNGTLTVSDTGIGIPPEHLDHVFERFYRVDKSHSKQSGGTGLGLSIVKHAAAYMNATISIKSEVGKGTSIGVKFPTQ